LLLSYKHENNTSNPRNIITREGSYITRDIYSHI